MSESTFFVPEGREIIITANGKNIFSKLPNAKDLHLIIDSGVSLSFDNHYTHLVEVKGQALLNLISNSVKVNGVAPPTGQFSLQGIEIWESTDNVSFTIDAMLYMVNSARSDVLIPSLLLTGLTLPGTSNKDKGIWGMSLVPPGPNIQKILQLTGASSQKLQDEVTLLSVGTLLDIKSEAASGTFDVQIGNYLTLQNVIITKIEPNYSEQLDEDLCPINCKLTIGFQTVEVATKDMINRILASIPSGSSYTVEEGGITSIPNSNPSGTESTPPHEPHGATYGS